MIVWYETTFDSAHFLPNVPDGHKCKRMHGHTFRVRVEIIDGLSEANGWVRDFAEIKSAVRPLVEMIDHAVLNDFDGLENPTSENIARWFFTRLFNKLPMHRVEVQETCSTGARYPA